MAIETIGFDVSMTVRDNGKGRSVLKYQLDSTYVADFAAAQVARSAIYDALDAMTDGVISNTALTERQFENALVLPASNIEIENKAKISLQLIGKTRPATVAIPAVVPSIFIGSSGASADQVDVLDSLVEAYADLYRDDATGYCTISDGDKIADSPNGNGVIIGKRTSSKNTNG